MHVKPSPHTHTYMYVGLCIHICVYIYISEVGGVSPTGKSFLFVRACVRAVWL